MAGGSLMRGWCSLMSDFRWLAAGLINPTDDFNHDNHDISQESFLLLKILCLHPHPGLYQYLYLYLYQYLYPHPYLYPYLNTFYIYTKSISVFLSVSIPISTSISTGKTCLAELVPWLGGSNFIRIYGIKIQPRPEGSWNSHMVSTDL